MRKLIAFVMATALAITSILNFKPAETAAATWPTGPDIYGTAGVLIDGNTGTVLYNKNMDKKMYPASITKIMTALLVIENCEMDEMVTFSAETVNSLDWEDANFGCQAGEKISVKDCLYLLMLHSANEVATALGEHVAGSTKEFAKMMNERAKQAGAKNTHFTNANGLHNENHYVTAYDMAMITRAAQQHEEFNQIVNSTEYTMAKTNKRKKRATAYQRHKMVWPTSGYYYEGIVGGKTGYTDQAGTTLVTYAKRNGTTLIAVVLHSNGFNVYKDTKALLDFGFSNFESKNVSKNDNRFAENSDYINTLSSPFCDSNDSLYIDGSSSIILPKTLKFSDLKTKIEYKLDSDSFATISYSYGDKVLGTAKLKYKSVSNTPKEETTTKQEVNEPTSKTTVKTTASNPPTEATTEKVENKKPFKLPGFVIPLAIILIVISVIVVLVRRKMKQINEIRQQKRRRNR